MRSVYRPCRTWMFTSSPDRLRAEARRRGLIGAATEFRRSCGQAEPRGSVRCVCVRGALRRGRKWNKSLPRSEIGERDLVAEGERGKLPQTGGSAEKASYHRMYTTWNVRLGRREQDNLITNYYLLSTIYLNRGVRSGRA